MGEHVVKLSSIVGVAFDGFLKINHDMGDFLFDLAGGHLSFRFFVHD
jgi:hypothetical protein